MPKMMVVQVPKAGADFEMVERETTDSEDTLRFAEISGVRPMIEKVPLARAAEGYARMMGGQARFRVVLTM